MTEFKYLAINNFSVLTVEISIGKFRLMPKIHTKLFLCIIGIG